MDNKSYIPDNVPAELKKSWHIPRPTLARSTHSSQGSSSSNNSTRSASSGSQLLTAANLAQIHRQDRQDVQSTMQQNLQYYLQQANCNNENGNETYVLPTAPDKGEVDPDSVSVASSMHFTVVNMHHRPKPRSFCRKNQLTILVVTMSALFTIGIIGAIFYLEMRASRLNY